jgi:hypothetical protein
MRRGLKGRFSKQEETPEKEKSEKYEIHIPGKNRKSNQTEIVIETSISKKVPEKDDSIRTASFTVDQQQQENNDKKKVVEKVETIIIIIIIIVINMFVEENIKLKIQHQMNLKKKKKKKKQQVNIVKEAIDLKKKNKLLKQSKRKLKKLKLLIHLKIIIVMFVEENIKRKIQ